MGIEQMTAVPVQLANDADHVPSLYRIATLYPMISDPPSAGAFHVTKTLVLEIEVVGASGVVGTVIGSTAPLPEEEAAELPLEFMART
jgi:hypothetical protein